MKHLKKMMALVVAVVVVLAMGTTVFADSTITINRDSSWNAEGEAKNATYTYHKVLDAVITSAGTVNASTGSLTSEGNVVYTVDSAAKAEAINATDVLEAKLASDSKYYVTKKGTPTDAQILAAVKSMVENNATLFPGTAVTSDSNPVTLTVPSDGYYLIEASNGKDVIVQTIGSVEINEKNDYPTVDKKQKQANGTYGDAAVSTEVGTYIDYQITVHIPTDATKQIAVIDKMSAGLEYDSTTGLVVTPSVSYSTLASTDAGYDATITDTNGWQIKFASTVVEANRGQDIVITFRAKVTDAALTDTGKENEVTLNYDNGNYILKDDVDYEIYFAGIYKVDPNDANADMSGVKFTLADGDGTAVKVTYDSTNGYYVVDPNGTDNVVETRADGTSYTIKIRGLDNDKTYKLTETETKAGYNLLNGEVTLTKIKDEGTAFTDKAVDTYDRVENNKGTQLPSTGGIGTTIFYIIGAVLVIGAGVMLVARRRTNNEK